MRPAVDLIILNFVPTTVLFILRGAVKEGQASIVLRSGVKIALRLTTVMLVVRTRLRIRAQTRLQPYTLELPLLDLHSPSRQRPLLIVTISVAETIGALVPTPLRRLPRVVVLVVLPRGPWTRAQLTRRTIRMSRIRITIEYRRSTWEPTSLCKPSGTPPPPTENLSQSKQPPIARTSNSHSNS